jgi:hypothetical protein
MDVLEQFVPPSYPRTIQTAHKNLMDPVNAAALALAVVALAMTLLISLAVFRSKKKPCILRAKIGFLYLLLTGLLFVSLGSLTSALPSSDGLCIANVWLTNLGYSLELVPLVVKLAALNHLMQAGRQFRRIHVKSRTFYQASALIELLVLALLIAWTIIDAPREESVYTLPPTGSESSSRGTVIDSPEEGGFFFSPGYEAPSRGTEIIESFHCSSDKWDYWWVIFVSWQALLLLVAAVLAFQNREFREDLVETRTLVMMIYSHLLFVALRIATFVIQDSESNYTAPTKAVYFRSLLNSADVMTVLCIYFLPKLLLDDIHQSSSSTLFSSRTLFSASGSISGFQLPPSSRRLCSSLSFKESAPSPSPPDGGSNPSAQSSSSSSKKQPSATDSGAEDRCPGPDKNEVVDLHP